MLNYRNFFTSLFIIFLCGSAFAGRIEVLNNNNAGTGSLRQAILDANGSDTIVFNASVVGRILLDSALHIKGDVVIEGPGIDVLTVSGESLGRCMYFDSLGLEVHLSGMRLVDGYTNTGTGGCIFMSGASVLTLDSCALDSNRSTQQGGAIYHEGVLKMNRTYLRDNLAGGGGGCIWSYNGATLDMDECVISGNTGFDGGALLAIINCNVTIKNCLFSNNTGGNTGSAICVENTELYIENTTISGNNLLTGGVEYGNAILVQNLSGSHQFTLLNSTIINNSGPDYALMINHGAAPVAYLTFTISNTIFDNDSNYNEIEFGGLTLSSNGSNICSNGHMSGFLVGPNDMNSTDPMLGALADNGGFSQTHALLAGSPAINGAQVDFAPPADQRAYFRDSVPDIGAYEYNGFAHPQLVINEVDANSAGKNFVEIYDGGAGSTSLNNLSLIFCQGGTNLVTDTFDLTGYQTNVAGYFVAGNSGVANVNLVLPAGTFKSGSNAVILYAYAINYFDTGSPFSLFNIIDAAVHDTDATMNATFNALVEPDKQLNEDAFGYYKIYSSQRYPNGEGDYQDMSGFTQFRATPGNANTCVAPNAGIDNDTTVCDNGGNIDLMTVLGGSPEAGWTWYDDDASGALTGSIFEPSGAAFNTPFRFSYVVENGSCPSAKAVVTVTTDWCSGISTAITGPLIKLFPNPARNSFWIESTDVMTHLEIYSADGKSVYKKNLLSHRLNINCDGWDNGLYILKAESDGQIITKTISIN